MDAGIGPRRAWSAAQGLADLNLDGLLDLVVVNRRANVGLWRNVGAGNADGPEPMGNWLALRLADGGANRDAIGAWVEVTVGPRGIGEPRGDGRRRACRRPARLDPLRHRRGGRGRACGSRGRTARRGPAVKVDANTFSILERDATEPTTWQAPDR